jgi:hypothetical protein
MAQRDRVGFAAEEVGRRGTADQFGPAIHERGEMVHVQQAGRPVEPGHPALHAPPEPRQDLVAEPVPGYEVGVVLQHRRDDVVAVAELREEGVHDGVVNLGGVPEGGDVAAAGRVEPPGDGVVRALEQLGGTPGRRRLAPVHVVVPGDQAAVQVGQLPRRLGTRGVVGDHPAGADEVEMRPDPVDVQLTGRRSVRTPEEAHCGLPHRTGKSASPGRKCTSALPTSRHAGGGPGPIGEAEPQPGGG